MAMQLVWRSRHFGGNIRDIALEAALACVYISQREYVRSSTRN